MNFRSKAKQFRDKLADQPWKPFAILFLPPGLLLGVLGYVTLRLQGADQQRMLQRNNLQLEKADRMNPSQLLQKALRADSVDMAERNGAIIKELDGERGPFKPGQISAIVKTLKVFDRDGKMIYSREGKISFNAEGNITYADPAMLGLVREMRGRGQGTMSGELRKSHDLKSRISEELDKTNGKAQREGKKGDKDSH